MSVVTVDEYRDITGDSTLSDAEVQVRLDRSEKRVSEYLLRPLVLGTYTDTLKTQNRWTSAVHPLATPVVSVSAPDSSVIIDGVTVYSGGLWPWDMITEHEFDTIYPYRVTLTYVGGWDTTTMPQTLKELIITLALRMVPLSQVSMTAVPVGAIQVKLGDAAVRFDRAYGSGGSIEALVPGITATLKQWRYRY